MGEVISDNSMLPLGEGGAPRVQPSRPRSLTRQILGDTLMRWGARLGAIWIGLLVIAGVFAPLIASTHPIIMKVNGEVSSPMLRHLTPMDVTLLVLVVVAGVLLVLRRISAGKRIVAFITAIIVTGLVTHGLGDLVSGVISPPESVNYLVYRQLESRAEKGGPGAPTVDYMVRTILPYSPEDYLRDQPETRLTAPSARHPLGTEINGADILSRLLHASRIALAIGFVSTGIAVFIGVVIGGLMGYFAKAMDMFGMRLVEIFEAIPTLFLILTFVAFFGHDIMMIMVILGVTGWTGYARFVRAEFLKLRHQDFVVAARACGLPLRSILFRHMLPNGMAPVLVGISFSVASAILFEATLSFLGLGPVGAPSWGALLEQARSAGGTFYWWVALFPGMAIFLTVFAYNLIGEALRDAIDPHTQRLNRG